MILCDRQIALMKNCALSLNYLFNSYPYLLYLLTYLFLYLFHVYPVWLYLFLPIFFFFFSLFACPKVFLSSTPDSSHRSINRRCVRYNCWNVTLQILRTLGACTWLRPPVDRSWWSLRRITLWLRTVVPPSLDPQSNVSVANL